jgi:hypothetical protein
MMGALEISSHEDALRFAVRVKPRSSRSKMLGIKEGALEVALEAPPVDGAANEALVRLLAQALSIARSRVRIAVGARGRRKVVEIEGLDRDELLRRLEGER